MEKIKKNKNYIVIGAIALLAFALILILVYRLDSDGMTNIGIYNIKYQINQDGNWSKKVRNGKTIGDKTNPIKDIKLNINNTNKGKLYYSVYTNKWSNQSYEYSPIDKEIRGIRIGLSDALFNKYSVCYRTYNKKDKWLNWTCDYGISGNDKESITAIEIKIIPKNVIKFDYLRDFNKVKETSKNF